MTITILHLIATSAGSLVVGALAGAFIDHKFSVVRDRRNEFNELADPLRATFQAIIRSHNPIGLGPSDAAIDRISERMGTLACRAFRHAIKKYYQAEAQAPCHEDGHGGIVCDDPTEVQKAAKKVLKYLHRK